MQYQTINLSLIKFDSQCFNSSEIQVGNLKCLISQHQQSKLDCRSHPTTFSHLLRKVVDDRICVFISDYRLVGHVIESLLTDELDCGLRCVRNKKCQSYNCFSDEHHGTKTCELKDQTRHSKPASFRANRGFTYYGKGRE